MKPILFLIPALLPSCTLVSGQKTAEFQPDPETLRAITEMVHAIQATK